MSRISLSDGAATYDVTVLEAARPSRVVLFAVGGGGSPERHLPLLKHLADCNCLVIAPHHDRLMSMVVTENELEARARRLRLALERLAPIGLPIAGVGHSIGTTMLLGLAGGQVWMREGSCVPISPIARLDRLALLTPATGFFQAPGALDAVNIPILAWAGTLDTITPPSQAEYLKQVLGARVAVEVRVIQNAGHFSFMNEPPPNTVETLADRESFLANLAEAICRFVTS